MNFFKKLFRRASSIEKKVELKSNSIILGMVLLEEPSSLDIDNMISELKDTWGLDVSDVKNEDGIAVFDVNGYNIAIADTPVPIPSNEVEEAAKCNYFWKDGVAESAKHNGHILVSMMNAGKNQMLENILYSMIASSVMNNSKAIGIYIGSRSLMLKKDFYIENVKNMSPEELPLYIWIYFRLGKDNGKQSISTCGLADFGKLEMEILSSTYSMREISEMMFNLAHYVLLENITLKHGETIGMSATQKLHISISEGKYIQGDTIKIEY